ncbi:hypothetical protein FGO68_gene12071 [Halteria grandinella]|uniref:Uncharacterized protein n=1 Tax=Halteria grandinella TaxID=5974 RepID=A0A8J8T6Z9_HALGN|nr:hypothetical protein FGO68_gene12071 [Halteria grandinella]
MRKGTSAEELSQSIVSKSQYKLSFICKCMDHQPEVRRSLWTLWSPYSTRSWQLYLTSQKNVSAYSPVCSNLYQP